PPRTPPHEFRRRHPVADCVSEAPAVAWSTQITVHSRSAMSATAALTATGTRAYTSAAWFVAQSTIATVTTLGSFGGGSSRQSPMSRSTQLLVRGLCGGVGAATEVDVRTFGAAVAPVDVVSPVALRAAGRQ